MTRLPELGRSPDLCSSRWNVDSDSQLYPVSGSFAAWKCVGSDVAAANDADVGTLPTTAAPAGDTNSIVNNMSSLAARSSSLSLSVSDSSS